jgi:PAS domain S-box-containing protein
MESGAANIAHTRTAGPPARERSGLPANRENELLRFLADITPLGIVQADADGRFTYANARWCQMTGYPRETALGLGWDQVVHPEDVETVREAWSRMREYGVPFSLEFRYLQPTGKEVWVCSQAMELRDAHGHVTGYLGTATEITEVRRMREEVLRSQARLEKQVRERMMQWEQMAMIVSSSADAIVSCDITGRIISWNRAAERIFGYTLEEMAGRTPHGITPEERWQEAEKVEQRVRRGERVDNFETVRMDRHGELVEVAISVFPLQDDSGVVTGTCAVLRDIREQKKAERHLHQLSGRLLRVQDEERRRLARELHDATAQSLAALSINLGHLNNLGAELPEAKRADLLADCLALADGVGSELRTHAYLLHPPLLEECGLSSALRWLVEGFSKRSGIAVALALPPELKRLDEQVELTIFRIAQESLSNIHRHTKSRSAEMRLNQQPGEITLAVRDEGGGPSHQEEECPGVGIAGMRERLMQIGGSLLVTFHPTGATVFARIPLP